MSFELWLSFTLATCALLAIPGPTVMLIVSYALGQGRATGWATVPGLTLGDFTAMTISLLGAGAVLAASATLFTVLKLAGAAYLVWLGVQLLRAKPVLDDEPKSAASTSQGKLFWNAYIVTALNPKSIVFFIAFVPLFVDPGGSALTQFAILEATFLSLAAVNGALWVVLAGQMRRQFQRPATLRLVNRIGGGVMIGAGLLLAATRR